MASFTDSASDEAMNTTIPAPLSLPELPLSSSTSISLVSATLLERHQCWHINSQSWRGPLSVQQYLGREALLERQPLTRDGRIAYWMLTDTSLPVGKDGARPILASCETLRKDGYLATNGRLQKIVTHGIGSVFCRHEYRGRGYASRMLTELGKVLETWQQPTGSKATFSMLWSDIGRSFYAAHGWKPMSSTHISLPPANDQTSSHTHDIVESSRIRDLSVHDLENRICPEAIAVVEARLRLQSQEKQSVTHIAIRPDYDHMAWHHAREQFQAKTLYRKDPYCKGAEDFVTGCAMIWSRVYGETAQNNKLHILHTMIPVDSAGDVTKSIAALLLRAQQEAKEWDMHAGVELWSPAAAVVDAAQILAGEEKVQITIRDKESVCSLKWQGEDGQEVEWVANEKYAWC